MTKICLLICATLAYITVASAQCSLSTFSSCLNTAHQAKETSMQGLETSFAACFTAQQCSDVKPPRGEHHGHHGSGSGSANFAAEEATRNQSRQCREAVESACVAAATGVTLPEMHKPKHHGHKGGPGGPHGPHGDMKPEDHLKAACVNSTVNNATGLVKACLEGLKSQMNGFKQTFCAAKTACVSSAGCTNATLKTAFEAQRNASKTCWEQASATKQAAAASVSQCSGLNLTAVFEKRGKHGKEHGGEEMKGGRPPMREGMGGGEHEGPLGGQHEGLLGGQHEGPQGGPHGGMEHHFDECEEHGHRA